MKQPARTPTKGCVECGRTVYAPESDWCYDCVMGILSSDTPKAVYLTENPLPLSVQIYAAGHCSEYAQIALANSSETDESVLSYMAVCNPSPAVRQLAVKHASLPAAEYAMFVDPESSVVEAALEAVKTAGRSETARRGQARLAKMTGRGEEEA